MLPRMHGMWPRELTWSSRAGSHPADPTSELPPKKRPPKETAGRQSRAGLLWRDLVRSPAGEARRPAGTGGRQPWGTGAKEGSFRPPPIGPRGSRGDPGIADRHVPTAPNPPGVRADSHGPPFAGLLTTALTRRHPCTVYTRLRRREAAARRQDMRGRLLASEPPPAEGRLEAQRRRGAAAAGHRGDLEGLLASPLRWRSLR